MFATIISFLGSSAGGSLLGFVMDWMAERRQAKRDHEEREFKRDLAFKNQISDYAKTLDNHEMAKPAKRKVRVLWGLWEWEGTVQKVVRSPRAYVVAASLFLLVCTYCAIILLWVGQPDVAIYSLDPDATPTRFGIPFLFMVERPPAREPVVQNAGGVVFLMLLSLNFLLHTAIVGVFRNSLRRN